MSPHAVCVTADPQLRRTLRRALGASGTTVEFVDTPAALSELRQKPEHRADLIVLDPTARRAAGDAGLGELGAGATPPEIVVLGESLAHDDVLELLRSKHLNHIISDIGGDLASVATAAAARSNEELVVTIGKLARGDIFGLEKYLAWGVLVRERFVQSYDQKRDAILEVVDYAGEVGARRQTAAKIEAVVDELLMNAMYDAPALRYGVPPHGPDRSRGTQEMLGDEPAILRYASDGRWFAVSVRDNYGELRKDAILAALLRARADKGMPQVQDGGGAGLGMYFILTSVTRFVANISPGNQTEVICLFDLHATGRDPEQCARSLNIFTAG